jgi:energy-coupling factor transport system permease protein
MDLMRSLPLGLYLERPVTWMHRLDPRVKLGWLMSFLLLPLLASLEWRLGIAVMLMGLTVSARIPWRVWRQQMGWLLALCLYVCTLISIAPDGLNAEHQVRQPADEIKFLQQPATLSPNEPTKPWYQTIGSAPKPDPTGILTAPNLPSATDYRYVLFQNGIITVTNRSLSLAIRFSTLLFTLLYSTTLYLLTTSPEEITAGLEDLMSPLRRFGVPVTEIALTLTLSLRFIPLVLEEFQNLVRSVRTRAIDWKQLGIKRSVQIWLTVAERLVKNLLLRAEQISSAMTVRGFTSPNEHQVQWHQLTLSWRDTIALLGLGLLWFGRFAFGGEVI